MRFATIYWTAVFWSETCQWRVITIPINRKTVTWQKGNFFRTFGHRINAVCRWTFDPILCASAVMMFAFDSVNKNVMTSSTTGSFTFQQYDKCLEACRTAAIKLFDFFRMSVERKLSKDAKFMDINMA